MPAVEVSVRVLVCLLAGAMAGVGTPWVLRRLPEPDDPQAPGYRFLAHGRFLAVVVLATVVMSATAVWTLPVPWWPPWLVLATAGVLLGAIDAATTWLPNALMYPTWAAMALSALVCVWLGGSWTTVGRMAVVSAAWGLLFWLVWVVSRRRIGFGDVRLAFALGAAAGAPGWLSGYTCLLLGTIVGALWGVLHRLRRGAGAAPFAYGPALVAGCWLGLLATALTTPM